jgi:type II secretory pathway pseudopilin PulG
MRIRLKNRSKKGQSGIGLIELFIALAVLLVGLTALLELCLAAAYTNNKNGKDTSATLLAQMVLEQVSSQHPDSTATITLTDCANVAHTVATAGGAGPNGAGANIDVNVADPTYGMIDWSQLPANVTANYQMQYTDCAANGRQTVYDVRWNIITISANETRMITVSARQLSSWNTKSGGGGLRLAIPVTLRGIGGP